MSNLISGKKYTKYKTLTGEISGQFGTSENNQPFSNFVQEDESYIEGDYLASSYKIIDGNPVSVGIAKLKEKAISEMKSQRVEMLFESDWTQGADSPLSEEKKLEWATYSQALRDITITHPNIIDIQDVVWPQEPQ